MNGCDYNQLIKGRDRGYARDHCTLCAVSFPATETAECAFFKWFHCARFFIFKTS